MKLGSLALRFNLFRTLSLVMAKKTTSNTACCVEIKWQEDIACGDELNVNRYNLPMVGTGIANEVGNIIISGVK